MSRRAQFAATHLEHACVRQRLVADALVRPDDVAAVEAIVSVSTVGPMAGTHGRPLTPAAYLVSDSVVAAARSREASHQLGD